MLGNRALQVKLVRTKKAEEPSEEPQECTHLDPELISLISQEFVVHTFVAAGIVYSAVKVLDTISKIAVIAAKAKIR